MCTTLLAAVLREECALVEVEGGGLFVEHVELGINELRELLHQPTRHTRPRLALKGSGLAAAASSSSSSLLLLNSRAGGGRSCVRTLHPRSLQRQGRGASEIGRATRCGGERQQWTRRTAERPEPDCACPGSGAVAPCLLLDSLRCPVDASGVQPPRLSLGPCRADRQ